MAAATRKHCQTQHPPHPPRPPSQDCPNESTLPALRWPPNLFSISSVPLWTPPSDVPSGNYTKPPTSARVSSTRRLMASPACAGRRTRTARRRAREERTAIATTTATRTMRQSTTPRAFPLAGMASLSRTGCSSCTASTTSTLARFAATNPTVVGTTLRSTSRTPNTCTACAVWASPTPDTFTALPRLRMRRTCGPSCSTLLRTTSLMGRRRRSTKIRTATF
mmetsp:Transcript_7605/g.21175  ORF Transcript_7605/g.21175 Transcript_7605/m.21175 type:complete len:222 (+) Transcript_7605:1441-2106(+)